MDNIEGRLGWVMKTRTKISVDNYIKTMGKILKNKISEEILFENVAKQIDLDTGNFNRIMKS